jgi:glycine betaine/proline transport system ATP-binding protein
MQPIVADAPRVKASETLTALIYLAIDHERAILVADNGKDVGVVSRTDILRTVVEGTEMS